MTSTRGKSLRLGWLTLEWGTLFPNLVFIAVSFRIAR